MAEEHNSEISHPAGRKALEFVTASLKDLAELTHARAQYMTTLSFALMLLRV